MALQNAAYYHEKFLKGKPGLASQIKRIKKKGTGPRKPANPDTEPNFYQMPPLTKGGMHDINIGTDSDCILSHVVSLPEYDLHYGTDDDDDEVLSAPSAPEPDGTTSGSGRKTVLLDAFNASPRSIVSGVNLSAFLDELLLLSKTNDGQNDDDGAEIYAMA